MGFARAWGSLTVTGATGCCLLMTGLLVPGPASAAHPATARQVRSSGARVTGTITYVQPQDPYHPGGARATWTVDGNAVTLRQEAPLVGITDLTGLSNTDELFAHMNLTDVQADPPAESCEDGTAATYTLEYTGIADPSSALSFSFLTVNRYTGKGTVHVNVAESPTRPDDMLASGTVNAHYHADCYGSVVDYTEQVPVMGEEGGDEPLGTHWAIEDTYAGTWKVSGGAHGGWTVGQHRVLSSTSYDSANETIHLTFTGSLPALNASCTFPSVHRLRSARTYQQADAFARRGGFSHFRNVAKYSRAAPRGHFYVLEGVGNAYTRCGQRHLHIVKSRGWPS